MSLQMCSEEVCDFVKGNFIHLVIQIHMACAGNNHQFLVVALQFFECVFAEIAGMCFFTVDKENGAPNFAAIGKKRHIDK